MSMTTFLHVLGKLILNVGSLSKVFRWREVEALSEDLSLRYWVVWGHAH